LLYGQGHDLRFTQDSPVLPDVWAEYAERPDHAVDLLLTPFQDRGSTSLGPAQLAAELEKTLLDEAGRSKAFRRADDADHQIAVNQTTVAARLWFDELVRVVLPLSSWWHSRLVLTKANEELRKKALGALDKMKTAPGRRWLAGAFATTAEGHTSDVSPDLYWTVLVVGAIAMSNQPTKTVQGRRKRPPEIWPVPSKPRPRQEYFERLFGALAELFAGVEFNSSVPALVHLVSRNRPATTCLSRSVPAVKADAAVNLFKIDCADITWAVADSGIDARHPAFRRRSEDGQAKPLDKAQDWSDVSRVTATYDFTIIRRILSTADNDIASLPPKLQRILKRDPTKRKEIRARLLAGREIDWPLLMPFLRIPHDADYVAPVHDHGTHVAGILGADWRQHEDHEGRLDAGLIGMCPTINLFDMRILNDQGQGDEFSVMAALQFLRYLNSHKDFMVVHGVNLSLSIRHEVANYACGRTPICEECESLVASGIVVVAAAGNEGFDRATTFATGREYQSISITDPGNAASVITVGATHRDMPHTYGVSYFSSRGPTGDGRLKPDLVAPGEKIDSTAPENGLVRKDGTSMAAPHVSGAAALLLARHREFLGQPHRVKAVLCESATDLGRERYFQGHGMLDVLRALQSV
jgi:hypothetical protein